MKIRFLFSGNFEVNNKVNAYLKDDIIEVSEEDADRLIVGLCAELATTTLVEKPKKYKEAKYDR